MEAKITVQRRIFRHYRLGLGSILLLPLLGLSACASGDGAAASSAGSTAVAGIVVSPSRISLLPGGAVQFNASVTGASNTAVIWSVNGQGSGNSAVGSINSAGLYLAPAAVLNTATISVTAALQADPSRFGTAAVTLSPPNGNGDAQAFPIKLGTSGGNVYDLTALGTGVNICCSGTLGSLVQRGGQQFILSNNHVLDRSGRGVMGDPVSQPGLANASCNASSVATVAHLSQAAPLQTSNVDAALAEIVTGAVDLSGTILGLGSGSGTDAPPAAIPASPAVVLASAEPVAKSGGTTGLTCSTLESIDTSVQVDYQATCGDDSQVFTVTFANQVIVEGGNFAGSGDSGSLIVTADTAQPVALLYAGTSQSSVGNPLEAVLAALADPNTGEEPTMVGGPTHAVACPASATNYAVTAKQRLPEAEIARAAAAKRAVDSQLLTGNALGAIEIGNSDDAPGEAALLIYVNAGGSHRPIPAQIHGVRTKIVTTQGTSPAEAPVSTSPLRLTADELSLSAAVKNKHASFLLHQPGVIGVGVGASMDAAGESAVIVYLENGMPSTPIPATLDGRRTRLITTDRFRTFGWGHEHRPVCAANSVHQVSHSADLFVH